MLDFEYTPKITREFLLSKNNQETYMAYYLGFPIDKKLHKNPLRADNKVTCAFFKGKSGILYFKDFATGDCLSFESVVMARFGCSYPQALDIIARDFGYIKGSNQVKAIKIQPKFEGTKQSFIQAEIKDFNEAELKWWYSYGITSKILNKFKVFSCKTVFLNGVVHSQSTQHSPIYGYYFGKKENIEQWKIYFPKRKDFRFLGNISSKTLQGYKQLPKKGKLLIITKSMKDVMALYSYGISAIAPNSETLFVSDEVLEELKNRFENIVVWYDNDLPGISNMNKIKKAHPELTYFFIPRKLGAKDFSDLRALYGKEQTLEYLKQWLKNYNKK